MAFTPVPNVCQVELRYLIAGQRCENTLYFRMASGFTTADMIELGDELINWWRDEIAPLVGIGVQLVEAYVTNLTTETSAAVSVVPTVTALGQVNEELLPLNVAPAVSFRTAGRGRSSRGRNYIAGITNSNVAGSIVESSWAANVVAAYNALFTLASTLGVVWGVVSRFNGGNRRTEGIHQAITTVLFTDLVVDSQRRRLPAMGI